MAKVWAGEDERATGIERRLEVHLVALEDIEGELRKQQFRKENVLSSVGELSMGNVGFA